MIVLDDLADYRVSYPCSCSVAVNQPLQVLSRHLSNHSSPSLVALQGAFATQGQDLALGLVEPHIFGLRPWIQYRPDPLQSPPTLQQINSSTQPGVLGKLAEPALNLLIQVVTKNIKHWPQCKALGNTTWDWPPAGCNCIHNHSLGPDRQPKSPAKSPPIQVASFFRTMLPFSELNSVRVFPEVLVDNTHNLSLV